MASAARRAPEPASAPGSCGAVDSSFTHADPTPIATPVTTPNRNRPTNSAGSATPGTPPSASTPLAGTDTTSAGTSSARRPHRSDAGPPSSTPGTSPATYTPNTPATTTGDSCACSR